MSKIWRAESIKNIRENIHDIEFGNDFFNMKQETQETKGKLLEWKIKTFYVLKKWSESHSVVSDSLWPHGLYSPWNSPGQNTGMGSHSLLKGIFPTHGSNPGLPHCRWILYQLSHQVSPRTLEWGAYPFSSRSSWLRNWIGVSGIAGSFFTNWAMGETPWYLSGEKRQHRIQRTLGSQGCAKECSGCFSKCLLLTYFTSYDSL